MFPKDHPVVIEEMNLLKERRKHQQEQYDLNWTRMPKQTKPRWLKKHWNMMKKLEAG